MWHFKIPVLHGINTHTPEHEAVVTKQATDTQEEGLTTLQEMEILGKVPPTGKDKLDGLTLHSRAAATFSPRTSPLLSILQQASIPYLALGGLCLVQRVTLRLGLAAEGEVELILRALCVSSQKVSLLGVIEGKTLGTGAIRVDTHLWGGLTHFTRRPHTQFQLFFRSNLSSRTTMSGTMIAIEALIPRFFQIR